MQWHILTCGMSDDFKMLPLRSLNHNESAYVQFQNKTYRSIDVVWINYMGEFQKYTTLKPTENINIDTYKTHPWIFVDRQTGVKMRVGSGTVFYPISNREVTRRLGLNSEQNFRIPIKVRLPLFTLRQLSLQIVSNLLRNTNELDSLQLPLTLKRDILRLSQEKREIFSKYEW